MRCTTHPHYRITSVQPENHGLVGVVIDAPVPPGTWYAVRLDANGATVKTRRAGMSLLVGGAATANGATGHRSAAGAVPTAPTSQLRRGSASSAAPGPVASASEAVHEQLAEELTSVHADIQDGVTLDRIDSELWEGMHVRIGGTGRAGADQRNSPADLIG